MFGRPLIIVGLGIAMSGVSCAWNANQRVARVHGLVNPPNAAYGLPSADPITGFQANAEPNRVEDSYFPSSPGSIRLEPIPIDPYPAAPRAPYDGAFGFEDTTYRTIDLENTRSTDAPSQGVTNPEATGMLRLHGVTFDSMTGIVVSNVGASVDEIQQGLNELYRRGAIDAETYYRESARAEGR